MSKLFEKKTVIISGGLGDIGLAIAKAFAKQGASIALCDQHPASAATKALDVLAQYKIPVSYDCVDVSDAGAVRQWIKKVQSEQQIPTIIIVNAAMVTIAGIHTITSDQWSREIDVNLNGAFHLASETTRLLVQQQQPGRVVFIGSWAAYTPHTHIPAYCVSKAGLRMLCKCMALELAAHNILVNEIAPGFVEAGLSARVWEKDPQLAKEAVEKVPVHKLITAEAVAGQVIQLCHPNNVHMTGSTILMDGGLSLLS
ncbi:MAG TPA: SDR family oxidoreductase [Chitinophagaceae bacterium]|nr:SDR family oxidoreductase [Chitinophagaceae bacterium]